jgi:competence protein ComEC
VVIEVLGPLPEPFTGTDSDIDNNSAVLKLTCGEVSFLLTGDIMSQAERELLRGRAAVATGVLKVAHHGSATSTTAAFLAVAGPQVAVISCGEDNRHGHPDSDVIDRLDDCVSPAYIYRTDEHGSIDFVTDGQTLRVKTAR